MSNINDHEFDLAHEIIQSEIASYIERAYRTCSAGLGGRGSEPDQRRIVAQMRHLHLAEPWLPASAATRRLRKAGLLAQMEAQ